MPEYTRTAASTATGSDESICKGKGRHALDVAHERHERRRLVDFGQARVHVERVGARFRLGNGFTQHIVEIALAKRGLEASFCP